MLTSTELTTSTINNTNVETEIALLNVNILSVANTKTVTVTRTSNTNVNGTTVTGTPMTTSNVYYSVWQNSTTDTFKLAEMQKVIDYYSKLGYTINRISDDLVHLSWKISW
jgi:hypothetical protein